MLAQRLRHQITLQSQSTSVDAYGGNVATWADVATVPAAIEPISGTEALKSGQNVADQNVRVVIRWRAGVTAQMRAKWGAVLFEVLSVADFEESRRMIEMICRRGRSES